jgi:hypothetical protein
MSSGRVLYTVAKKNSNFVSGENARRLSLRVKIKVRMHNVTAVHACAHAHTQCVLP